MTPLPEGIIRTPEGIYVLRTDSHLSRWCEQAKRLDIAEGEIAHFASHIPVGGIVIDAGACLGDHAATYSKLVGPTGTVLAIEPGELTYQALWRNMEAYPNVKAIHAALGAHEGRARHEIAENVGGSHLGGDGEDNVDLTTIDALKLGRLDFIHLDCEGFEPFALRGGTETIRRCRPAMVIEINKGALARFGQRDTDVYLTLNDLGYDWRELWEGHGTHMEQRDILCLPR